MNRRSRIVWAIATGLLMVVGFVLPHSIIFAFVAAGVVVLMVRIPVKG